MPHLRPLKITKSNVLLHVLQKSDANAAEKNRAMRAALNAELRKEKVLLQQEVEVLHQMIQKKGLSSEDIDERRERYEEVQREVDAVDDGLGSGVKSPSRLLNSPATNGTRNGSSMSELKGSLTYDGAYTHTAETQNFVKDAAAAQVAAEAEGGGPQGVDFLAVQDHVGCAGGLHAGVRLPVGAHRRVNLQQGPAGGH